LGAVQRQARAILFTPFNGGGMLTKRFRNRRHYDTWMTLVERRKGRAWMYGEIVVCVALIVLLIKLFR
jgi:hypothetical protein